MDKDVEIVPVDNKELEILTPEERAVFEKIFSGKKAAYVRVALAALGGLPWVGSVISAVGTYSAEKDQGETNQLLYFWIKEYEKKLKDFQETMDFIYGRFESFGERIEKRIESEEYLNLVRKTFQQWDAAETQEKKELLKKLITNAGGIELCPDDLVRLFLNWLDQYHDFHFLVVREIFNKPNITRGEIWDKLRDERPSESSAEADLFRLLIRDLSTGGVIRQASTSKTTGKSAFDNYDPYVLTELGRQFVHYVMTDLAPQLEGEEAKSTEE